MTILTICILIIKIKCRHYFYIDIYRVTMDRPCSTVLSRFYTHFYKNILRVNFFYYLFLFYRLFYCKLDIAVLSCYIFSHVFSVTFVCYIVVHLIQSIRLHSDSRMHSRYCFRICLLVFFISFLSFFRFC